MKLLNKLVTAALTSFFTVGIVCATDFTYGNITYRVTNESNKTVEVTKSASGQYYSDAVAIPSDVNGYTVVGVGGSAFEGCTQLTSISFASSITYIGNYAFQGCTALENFALPNSLTTIGYYAFEGCTSITSLSIPGSVNKLGGNEFRGCSRLASLTLKEGMETISGTMFKDCINLTSVNIPNSVTKIGDSSFTGCTKLTNLTIGNGVKTIASSAFEGCTALSNVTFDNNITDIGNYAFYGCKVLSSINLPSSLISIGYYAFNECSILRSITCRATLPPSAYTSTFSDNQYSSAVLYVPYSVVNSYKEAEVWKKFNNIQAIVEDITLTINDAEQGSVKLYLKEKGNSMTFGFAPASGWTINSVFYNNEDVTAQLVAGKFTTPQINSDAIISVVYQSETAIKSINYNSQIKIGITSTGLTVNGTNSGDIINIYDIDGRMLTSAVASSDITDIAVAYNGIILIKVGDQTYKVVK